MANEIQRTKEWSKGNISDPLNEYNYGMQREQDYPVG